LKNTYCKQEIAMKRQATSTQFFYQNGKLVTVNQGGQKRAIFRSTDIPLAEVATGERQATGLLEVDQNGSVLKVSEGPDEEESHSYSAYGHDPSLASARVHLGFNGELFDRRSSCYLLGEGYRAYSSTLGRFTAADSWSPFGRGGRNSYTYAGGDPINYIDPTGHVVSLSQRPSMTRSYSTSAFPRQVKPSTLKRTVSHASVLKASTPGYTAPREREDFFMKINEPDIFESIISNLSFQDAASFSNASSKINNFVNPILERYIDTALQNPATQGAARAGVLPTVPPTISQSMGLPRPEYMDDINRIQPLGGPENFLRLLKFDRQHTQLQVRRLRRDSLDALIAS
jgi:RHS repeat-associated protein